MTATLTITLDDAVIAALQESRTINITLAADGKAPAKAAKGRAAGGKRPRAGSLPDQIIAWAAEDGEPFDTAEVMEAFGINRGHASMVLGKVANGPYPIRRVKRGVYQYTG